MKILRTVIGIFIALAIGAAAGYWYALQLGEARRFFFDMAEFEYYTSFMSIQMSEGTDATREEAIRHHLALIETKKGHASSLYTEKTIATDSALGYARLSLLARKRGALQEAQQLLGHAASFCPRTSWAQCDEKKLLSGVQQLDKQGVFALHAQ